jgi:uncharacterized OB-fold protein
MESDMTEISDADVLQRFPSAWVDRDTVDLFRGFLEHKLLINKCDDCSKWYQPPWPICPHCGSHSVTATEVSGKGTVFTYTILHTGGSRGVDYVAGHPVAVIELAEQPGLRITATIVDCAKEDIRIEMPVELTWIERNGDPIPAFRPSEGGNR